MVPISTINTIILGIDGATWYILEKEAETGNLPVIKSLMNNGTWGPLETCIPPITAPAWTSIATGKNPGKTGVFDFFNRTNENDLTTQALTSYQIRKAQPLWDILSENNYKVGIWNYPMLYPPYEINGYMVSGLGSSPKDCICYPKTVQQELFSICPHYATFIPHAAQKYIGNEHLFIEDVSQLITDNEKILTYLLETKQIDFFFGVISTLDFMQHYLWKHIDNEHPLYKEKNPFKQEFYRLLQRIDDLVGKVKDLASSNTNIFLVSDHGFGPHKSNFFINQFLADKTFLKRINKRRQTLQIASKLPKVLQNIPFILRNRCLPENIGFNKIDMEKSIAISINSVGVGGISINPQLVRDRPEYVRIRDEVITALEETCRSLDIRCEIFLPEDIYQGEFTRFAPDIYCRLNGLETSISRRFHNEVHSNCPPDFNHSGEHRMNGIFLAYGPTINKGKKIHGATIYDIAPTILHMFNLPYPNDMDGRVLYELFQQDTSLAKKPVVSETSRSEKETLKNTIKQLQISGKLQ